MCLGGSNLAPREPAWQCLLLLLLRRLSAEETVSMRLTRGLWYNWTDEFPRRLLQYSRPQAQLYDSDCVAMTWEAEARARHRLESSLSESLDSDGDGVTRSSVVDGPGPMRKCSWISPDPNSRRLSKRTH